MFEQRLALARQQLGIGINAIVQAPRLRRAAGGALGVVCKQPFGDVHQELSFVQHETPCCARAGRSWARTAGCTPPIFRSSLKRPGLVAPAARSTVLAARPAGES